MLGALGVFFQQLFPSCCKLLNVFKLPCQLVTFPVEVLNSYSTPRNQRLEIERPLGLGLGITCWLKCHIPQAPFCFAGLLG